KNIDEGRQSILLMNRRGYNTYVACESCGTVVTCPNCSISLTYHNANRRLMCHYCGYSIPFSRVCPECGEEAVRYSGSGTQKVEEELAELLPGARILRMDADTTMQKYAYDRNLSAFRDGEYDIMVGTQMVAKGLDFENVTLVGVLNADKELYNDDFQSMERTFDLITQVVGRAGRGRWSGKAVIQTMNPGNEVIRFAREQDYESFYSYEIGVRKAMVYPPFCTLVSVGFRGAKQERVEQAAAAFLDLLKERLGESNDIRLIALGPMPERVVRVGGTYRYRVLIKCRFQAPFRKLLSELLCDFGRSSDAKSITTVVDVENG
ncbi:MAG: primosomal protein N', partial [Clostridia bacterium]|nr:primosomal protein N' [Clostridia bacterium]